MIRSCFNVHIMIAVSVVAVRIIRAQSRGAPVSALAVTMKVFGFTGKYDKRSFNIDSLEA